MCARLCPELLCLRKYPVRTYVMHADALYI